MDKQELVRIMTGLFEGNHGAAQTYAENNQPFNRNRKAEQGNICKSIGKVGTHQLF